HRRNSVAGTNTGARKRRGQSPHALVELSIIVTIRAVDHGDALGMDLRRSRQERYRREGGEICGGRSHGPEDVTPAAGLAPTPDQRRLARPAETTGLCLAKQLSGWLWLGWLGHILPPLARFG